MNVKGSDNTRKMWSAMQALSLDGAGGEIFDAYNLGPTGLDMKFQTETPEKQIELT